MLLCVSKHHLCALGNDELQIIDWALTLAVQSWTGTVTELIPPNYGIVDGNAFFINQVVMGKTPQVSSQGAKHGLLCASHLTCSL